MDILIKSSIFSKVSKLHLNLSIAAEHLFKILVISFSLQQLAKEITSF